MLFNTHYPRLLNLGPLINDFTFYQTNPNKTKQTKEKINAGSRLFIHTGLFYSVLSLLYSVSTDDGIRSRIPVTHLSGLVVWRRAARLHLEARRRHQDCRLRLAMPALTCRPGIHLPLHSQTPTPAKYTDGRDLRSNTGNRVGHYNGFVKLDGI